MQLKFTAECKDRQAEESAVKRLSQGKAEWLSYRPATGDVIFLFALCSGLYGG